MLHEIPTNGWSALLVLLAVGIQTILNHRGNRSTKNNLANQMARLEVKLTELKGISIGIDGQNGMRGDIRAIRIDFKELRNQILEIEKKIAALQERTREEL